MEGQGDAMKLKHLAALLLRILGVLAVVTGLSQAVAGIFGPDRIGAIVDGLGGLLVGGLMLYFSKPVAAILCRGLDDDSAG
jgi:hypothetical protein